jgi:hypothetical protein
MFRKSIFCIAAIIMSAGTTFANTNEFNQAYKQLVE